MSKMIQPVTFPEGVEFTLTGLTFPVYQLTFEQWADIGELLEQERRRKELQLFAIQCAIGDWINYGEKRYGEKHAQAIQESGRAYQTLANLAWVTGKIKLEDRRPHLSFAHHAAVAALPEDERNQLLDMAEMENATAKELRAYVQDHRMRESGKDPIQERARRALANAVIALTNVPRSQRARMIVGRLIEPLAKVAGLEREQFLSGIVSGICEIE